MLILLPVVIGNWAKIKFERERETEKCGPFCCLPLVFESNVILTVEKQAFVKIHFINWYYFF